MKPIYIELTPATGNKEVIKINFMEVYDIIAAHGNEIEFAGNVTHHDEHELPYTIIVTGNARIPIVQSSMEVISKLHNELVKMLR